MEWEKAWKEIKPELEYNGIVYCELGFEGCTNTMFLTPAHIDKRRNLTGNELKAVIMACVHCHNVIEGWNSERMRRLIEIIIRARPSGYGTQYLN